MNIYTTICNNQQCSSFDIEYRLIDQPGPIECGGCGNLLESLLTDELAPDAPVMATPEEISAEQQQKIAARESALAKLAKLGLTEEEARAVIGM